MDSEVPALARTTERNPTDPRDLPNYAIAEAAHYLALPMSTVRAWSVGIHHRTPAGRRLIMQALIQPAERRPPTLSFWNLVEIYVVASMRRRHRISMRRVRSALEYVERELHVERPLLRQEFFTDGVDLFVDRYSDLINVSQAGQSALRELLLGSLKRIERDESGAALRVFPWLNEPGEPQLVEIDPGRAAGRLVVAHTGIPTEELASRWRGGDAIEFLADDFNLTREQVEAALRWEQCALAA